MSNQGGQYIRSPQEIDLNSSCSKTEEKKCLSLNVIYSGPLVTHTLKNTSSSWNFDCTCWSQSTLVDVTGIFVFVSVMECTKCTSVVFVFLLGADIMTDLTPAQTIML